MSKTSRVVTFIAILFLYLVSQLRQGEQQTLIKRVISPEIPVEWHPYLLSVWEKNEANASKWMQYIQKGQAVLGKTYKPLFDKADEYRCPDNGEGIKLLIVIVTAPENRLAACSLVVHF